MSSGDAHPSSHHHHRPSSASSSLADGYYDDDRLFDNDDDPHEAHLLRHAAHSQAPPPSLQHPPSTSARKPASSLAQITVPPFSTFRSQVPRPNAAFQHHPSPRAASFSFSEKASPRLADPSVRPLSLDSPLPPQHEVGRSEPLPGESSNTPARQDELQDRSSYTIPRPSHERDDSIDSRIASTALSSAFSSPQRSNRPANAKHAHEHSTTHAPQHSTTSSLDEHFSPDSRSSMIAGQRAPTMTLQYDGVQRRLSDDSIGAASNSSAKRPKSPFNPLGTLFGWKGQQKSEGDSSPTTTFSERSLSPLPSPRLIKTLPVEMDVKRLSARLTPPSLDIQKANGAGAYFDNPETPLLLGDTASNAHVRELERELQHISQELAASIRREMELEDELDRVRIELPNIPQSELSLRRSSDYFSDSGASSTKFPITDVDAKLEQMDKQVRKAEQEKANLKVETASRLQTELSRRRDLEELVQNLEDQLARHNRAGEERGNTEGKVEELESTLDETRRRLGQEKMTKENFEDLYSATREELEKYRNEADNLRNEVVPQLKARVEGLEAEASDAQAIVSENTRLQQQIAAMRDGNHSRFNSIAEEGVMNAGRASLSRSGSLARNGSLRRGGSISQKDGGRQRSGSMNGTYGDTAVKEIEDQRDALHKALKLLIKRHERQQQDHERAIKKLTSAKDKAEQITPRRTAYSKEVSFLKEEVTTLRKRTEDALEQKWQYEKNLSGLKMDLDRAEQETRGLRIILQENDISAPSEASVSGDAEADEDAQLKLSISRAEDERDHARQIAEEYRQKAQSSSGGNADELMNSAKRMEQLADQLEKQAEANQQLRERLAAAVAKGESEQKQSTRQVEEMQRRLAGMEDSVLAAQQHSETTLANHDAEVRRLEDASSPHLQRLRISIPEPTKLSPSSPLLKKSPKLGNKKLSETSLLEMSRTQMLERKVKELEGLLREAEEDMQVVVQRVNKSQMEVADLQTERDAALIQMRKLQVLIVEEREKAEALMP
ncbi:hypothetical protein M409DRAFT_27354 [Zasmidium cellare ATCC 36951]|uniref:DUF7603 domain-containing protein n=1 Tax=Zasmidium cellare ATCC 36951 TaxID=1080233 RepID=A0A6A6C809_ZASCE|nr:uncharacterized protein M409DRAFT_27354 [Zasmidium cellare ATCC 36951]KAF2162350.1 hypothetical protein M409DRAFT_27354 [Zasmidium cellare ATCC 36951]